MTQYQAMFQNHRHLRPVIDSVLEGRLGNLITSAKPFEAVRLDLGCYSIPGGDANSDQARDLIASVPTQELYVPNESWLPVIHSVYGNDLEDISMNAYGPGPQCRQISANLARSIILDYRLIPLDLGWAKKIGGLLTPNALSTYPSPRALVENGFGIIAVFGDQIACLATSYALSETMVEISISTAQDHRGQGLATCVAAAMLQASFERDIQPRWHASNPISQRLALRLGMQFTGRCHILKMPVGP